MRLIIVTGMSGAGKSIALNCLEDMGYYCMDNLPPMLLKDIYSLLSGVKGIDRAAIGVDVRGGSFFKDVYEELTLLDQQHIRYEILFLDCADEILIRRYKESRRSHPVEGKSLPESIRRERDLLQGLRSAAHTCIDTSRLNVHQLKARLTELYGQDVKDEPFPLHVMSFGFKNGIPQEADLVFDVRFLDNPFYIEELKPLSGLDEPVYRYVMEKPDTQTFMDKLTDLLDFLLPRYQKEGKSSLVIAMGCTGGRHRSVAIAETLAKALSEKGYFVRTEHRDLKGGGFYS